MDNEENEEEERFEDIPDAAMPIDLVMIFRFHTKYYHIFTMHQMNLNCSVLTPSILQPPCELTRLFEIREVMEGAMNSPIRRERLAVALQTENYIPVSGSSFSLLK